ncbi:MAG: hypothetical protein ACI4P0_00620, partial [Mailhella sp.]
CMNVQLGKQSLQFAEAPYIISSASIVGTKEGNGPLKDYFDVIGQDDKFGQNTWEEAESTLQKEAFLRSLWKNFPSDGAWMPGRILAIPCAVPALI